MQPDLLKKLSDPAQNIAMENHQFGVPPSHFDRWPVLKDDFVVISTTKDRWADQLQLSCSCTEVVCCAMAGSEPLQLMQLCKGRQGLLQVRKADGM